MLYLQLLCLISPSAAPPHHLGVDTSSSQRPTAASSRGILQRPRLPERNPWNLTIPNEWDLSIPVTVPNEWNSSNLPVMSWKTEFISQWLQLCTKCDKAISLNVYGLPLSKPHTVYVPVLTIAMWWFTVNGWGTPWAKHYSISSN